MREQTRIIHSGHERTAHYGASSVPIYQASTFHQPDPLCLGSYDYARSGNPTRDALEESIAALEGGVRGFAFSSGMAATSSVLLLFQPGDHLIACHDIYGGSYRALTTIFKRWGLEVSFVNTADPTLVRTAIRPNTRGLFIETPANPLLAITDLKAMGEIAQEHNLIAIVDNTFMSPWLQRPLEFGFDIVVHSATKFLGGHSDLVAGLAVVNTAELAQKLRLVHNTFGAILGPQDCWLLLRGMKTLAPRLTAQQQSASKIATWLSAHLAVRRVYYPGLPAHPGYATHLAQARGAGAVLSFELSDGAAAQKFMQKLKLPLVAVSLGGVESILSYPATMSHAAMPPKERQERGIGDGLMRLSVGLEDAEDLIVDLEQALRQ